MIRKLQLAIIAIVLTVASLALAQGRLSPQGGTITGVTAGNGLSGGGNGGNVTLTVNTGSGLAIVADSITVDIPGTGSPCATGAAVTNILSDGSAVCGSVGIAGTGTDGYLAKWTGSGSLGLSNIFDTGSQVQVNAPMVVFSGGGAFAIASDNGYSNLTNNNYSGILGSNYGTYNTTAQALTNRGVTGYSIATRSAGSNNLRNVGVWGEARNAQENYSFWGEAGELHNVGTFSAGTDGDGVESEHSLRGDLFVYPDTDGMSGNVTAWGGVSGLSLSAGAGGLWNAGDSHLADGTTTLGQVVETVQTVATTGNIDNLTLNSNTTVLRFTGASTTVLRGLTGGTNGRRVRIENATGGSLVVAPGAGTSLAANQFTTAGSLDNYVNGHDTIVYDGSKWRSGGTYQATAISVVTSASIGTTLSVAGDVTLGDASTDKTHVRGWGMVNALGTTRPTFEGSVAAALTVGAGGGDWGVASIRATNDASGAHIVIAKTRATDPATKTALVNGDVIGDLTWQGVDGSSNMVRGAAILATVTGTVSGSTIPVSLGVYTGSGTPVERLTFPHDGGYQMPDASAAAVSSSNTGRIRYTTSGQKFQVSANGGAYVDLVTSSSTYITGVSSDFTVTSQVLDLSSTVTMPGTLGVTGLATFSSGFVSSAASTIATTNTLGTNGIAIDRGTTPTQSQILVRASGTSNGATSITQLAADNSAIAFDAEYIGSAWIARDTSASRIVKTSDKLSIQRASGTSAGSTIGAWTDVTSFDLLTGTVAFDSHVTIGTDNADALTINAQAGFNAGFVVNNGSVNFTNTNTTMGDSSSDAFNVIATTTLSALQTTTETEALSTGNNSITLDATTSRLHVTYNGGSLAYIQSITAGTAGRVLWLTYAVTCNDCDSYFGLTTGGNVVGWNDVGGGPFVLSGNGVGMLKLISDGTYWYVDAPRATTSFYANNLTAGDFINGDGGRVRAFSAGDGNSGDGVGEVTIGESGGTTNVTLTNVRGDGTHFLRKTTLVTADDSTFDLQPGTRKIRIRAVGGGGGGGGADFVTSNRTAGGGGGAGQYGECWIDAGSTSGWNTIGSTAASTNHAIAIDVGTGGTGGSGIPQSTQVSSGTATTVAYALNGGSLVTLTFHAGNGGYNGFQTSTSNISVSAPGFTDMTSIGSSVCYLTSGDNGQMGVAQGAGGMYPGAGGSSPLGMGGIAVWNGNGGTASGYGGGGGGASTDATSDRSGGNGAPGAVIVEEYF